MIIHCTISEWLERGPAIVAVCPETDVLLTDRQPAVDNGVWRWHAAMSGPSLLPSVLFSRLEGEGEWRCLYGAQDAAIEDAGRAAVVWAYARNAALARLAESRS